ncbi:Hypothetical predicted protein, partial [Paramuricea clavata]
FGCNEFTNQSSAMLVLDSKCQRQGGQQIADFLPKEKKCCVKSLDFWDNHHWKDLDHEFKENLFAISGSLGKFLVK